MVCYPTHSDLLGIPRFEACICVLLDAYFVLFYDKWSDMSNSSVDLRASTQHEPSYFGKEGLCLQV